MIININNSIIIDKDFFYPIWSYLRFPDALISTGKC